MTETPHRRLQLDESKLIDLSRLGSWSQYKLIGNLHPAVPKDRETKQSLPQDGWLATVVCFAKTPFMLQQFDIKIPMDAVNEIPKVADTDMRDIADVVNFSQFSGWAKADRIILKGA
ncbi:hypothetical protein ACQUE4_13055 [Lactococcus lactis]|uniref:hypothetical protein n=1 Tax=Lactococcus lactis TaxID=1358 RepID=UPI0018A921EB|nr:hypothetical protein [Lactococcus lactis]